MPIILDTDHISLLQRGNKQVMQRMARLDRSELAVTVITVAEQLQGWLALIRRAKNEADSGRHFASLQRTIQFYQTIPVLPYDQQAQILFGQLRQQKVRIGTQDLRIAAIALTYKATVVTRNAIDFSKVPLLETDDWSIPIEDK